MLWMRVVGVGGVCVGVNQVGMMVESSDGGGEGVALVMLVVSGECGVRGVADGNEAFGLGRPFRSRHV